MSSKISKTKEEKVIFYDRKSLDGPLSEHSKYLIDLADNDPNQPGVVLPNGSINWACPCLGTAPIGPCSTQFRTAFSCFHQSEAEIKGSDCLVEFEKLNDCMRKFPKLYERENNGGGSNKITEENNN